jgi:hypothetical protein
MHGIHPFFVRRVIEAPLKRFRPADLDRRMV